MFYELIDASYSYSIEEQTTIIPSLVSELIRCYLNSSLNEVNRKRGHFPAVRLCACVVLQEHRLALADTV